MDRINDIGAPPKEWLIKRAETGKVTVSSLRRTIQDIMEILAKGAIGYLGEEWDIRSHINTRYDTSSLEKIKRFVRKKIDELITKADEGRRSVSAHRVFFNDDCSVISDNYYRQNLIFIKNMPPVENNYLISTISKFIFSAYVSQETVKKIGGDALTDAGKLSLMEIEIKELQYKYLKEIDKGLLNNVINGEDGSIRFIKIRPVSKDEVNWVLRKGKRKLGGFKLENSQPSKHGGALTGGAKGIEKPSQGIIEGGRSRIRVKRGLKRFKRIAW